jgi:hypothetical protein
MVDGATTGLFSEVGKSSGHCEVVTVTYNSISSNAGSTPIAVAGSIVTGSQQLFLPLPPERGNFEYPKLKFVRSFLRIRL